MRLEFNNHEEIAGFVANLIPGCEKYGLPQPNKSIGVVDNNENLIFGAVYHDYCPQQGLIEMTCAGISAKWATKKNIGVMLAHVFNACKCQMLLMRVSIRNERTIKLINGLGFDQQIIRRLYGRDEDGILFSLTDDQWRESKYYAA